MKVKLLALITTVALSAMLFAVASSATGAYFSDTENGAITGTDGAITVEASGGSGVDGLNFSWPNMMPGEVYSAAATYKNEGTAPQDVWLVFPNRTALSALASRGALAAVRITDSSTGEVFYSNNLNDHPVDQGAGPDDAGRGIVKMLPRMIRLRKNVAVGAEGTMTFKFQYAPRAGAHVEGLFNRYPLSTPGTPVDPNYSVGLGDGNLANYEQRYVYTEDGSDAGLPYQIVATQVDVDPGVKGAFAGF